MAPFMICLYRQIQCSFRITAESSNFVKKKLGWLADEDPHPLPLLLDLLGDGDGVGHHTEVWNSSANHDSLS